MGQVVIAQQNNKENKSLSTLSFFGSGNIQKSIDGGQKIPAYTGLGVNYSQKYDTLAGKRLLWNAVDKIELEAVINVASNVDTLVAAYDSLSVVNSSYFGSSILTSLNSGQAVKIYLRIDFAHAKFAKLLDCIKAKYVGSNRNWLVTDGYNLKTIKGTCNSLRIGAFHEFIPKPLLNDYFINLGVNFAYNSIKGILV